MSEREVKPPPAGSIERRALREAEERARAVPVYRVLKAWAEGPKQYGTWAEIVAEAGLFNIQEAIDAVVWMRGHGVAVLVSPGQAPGEPAWVTLSAPMPEAFEPT